MLKRLFGNLFSTPSASAAPKPPASGPPAPWRTTGTQGFVPVAGESHYQESLQQLSVLFETIGRVDRNFTVKLVPEPNNAFDQNAVAVVTEGNSKLGYLPRDIAKSYQAHLLRQPNAVTCPAR